MRVTAPFCFAAAALSAGSALAHPGHATLGPLAGAAHLHAFDIALVLLALGALVLAGPGARQRRSPAQPGLRARAASARARAVVGALAAVAALALLLV